LRGGHRCASEVGPELVSSDTEWEISGASSRLEVMNFNSLGAAVFPVSCVTYLGSRIAFRVQAEPLTRTATGAPINGLYLPGLIVGTPLR